jgi:hypothetical protein
MRPGIEIRDGEQIGRDPREMDAKEIRELGHEGGPLLKAIREKCLDCCVYQQSEVRKCTAVNCALWPYRMRSNPFHGRTGNLANAEVLAKWREAQKAAE